MEGSVGERAIGVRLDKQTYISVALVLTLVSGVVYIVSGITKLATVVDAQSNSINRIQDEFVPRTELDARLKNIESSVIRIEQKLDKQ